MIDYGSSIVGIFIMACCAIEVYIERVEEEEQHRLSAEEKRPFNGGDGVLNV